MFLFQKAWKATGCENKLIEDQARRHRPSLMPRRAKRGRLSEVKPFPLGRGAATQSHNQRGPFGPASAHIMRRRCWKRAETSNWRRRKRATRAERIAGMSEGERAELIVNFRSEVTLANEVSVVEAAGVGKFVRSGVRGGRMPRT